MGYNHAGTLKNNSNISGNFSITLGIAIFLFIKSWTQGLESAIVNS